MVRSFTDAMKTIANVIGEFIEKHFQHDKTVEISPFNNCVLTAYLPGMTFPEHRDVTYTKNGEYDASKNSQDAKTVTAILAIGEFLDRNYFHREHFFGLQRSPYS